MITRPPSSSSVDHENWLRDKEDRETEAILRGEKSKFGARIESHDPRLTRMIAWIGSVTSAILTGGILTLISMVFSLDKQVGILLARPESVSREQYNIDQALIRSDIQTLKIDVKDIQLKQAANLNERR